MNGYSVLEGFFSLGTYKNEHIIQIIDALKKNGELYNDIYFEGIFIYDEHNKYNEIGEKYLLNIDLNNESLYVKGGENKLFQFGRTKQYDWLRVSYLGSMNIGQIECNVIPLFLKDNLKALFLSDYWYSFFQTTELISEYQVKNLKYGNLPKYFNENTMLEMIDISKNPGRERFLPDMKFIPSYKIWYGKESQELFGREKILKYKNAIEIKELEDGIIEMQLMDDITKCDSRKNQERQGDIVKYLGIDKMEVSKY